MVGSLLQPLEQLMALVASPPLDRSLVAGRRRGQTAPCTASAASLKGGWGISSRAPLRASGGSRGWVGIVGVARWGWHGVGGWWFGTRRGWESTGVGWVWGGARVDGVRCFCGLALCRLRFVLVHLLCVYSEKRPGICRRLLQLESSSRPQSRCSHVKS